MTTNRIKALTLMLTAVWLLCGCSSADEELERYIHRIKSRPPKPALDPIPEFKSLPKFIYPENESRRSPFKQFQVVKPPDMYAPNLARTKQPLEEFPLDALQFVGILKQGPSLWGLISQPGGLISRVKVGDYMGKNFGQVTSVKETSITVVETIMVSGQWEKKTITLDLRVPK